MKWLIMIIIIMLDQLSKYWVLLKLKPMGTLPVFEGIFHLHYLENRGAAFGLFQNQRLFFILFTFIIVSGIIWYLIQNQEINKILMISLSLIAGGAVGNLIDRALYGYVIDFLDFQFWPVFNIADAAIVVGQMLLVYFIIKDHIHSMKEDGGRS